MGNVKPHLALSDNVRVNAALVDDRPDCLVLFWAGGAKRTSWAARHLGGDSGEALRARQCMKWFLDSHTFAKRVHAWISLFGCKTPNE
jgi:hypothetical protein